MITIPYRIVIYPKDVTNITGKKDRTARKLLTKIRKSYNKPAGSFVSVEEFCKFTGLKEQHVNAFLK